PFSAHPPPPPRPPVATTPTTTTTTTIIITTTTHHPPHDPTGGPPRPPPRPCPGRPAPAAPDQRPEPGRAPRGDAAVHRHEQRFAAGEYVRRVRAATEGVEGVVPAQALRRRGARHRG